jgi:multidrug resistance efflux pump
MDTTPSPAPVEALKPIPSPPGAIFKEFRIAVLPYLAFAGIFAATIWTWKGYVGPSSLVGEVESVKAIVSSASAGRLAQVQVDALQRVTTGQVVAQILPVEPRVLDAQIALSKARIDLLRVGMDPDLRKQNNRINYEKLRLDWMSKRVELMTAKAKYIYVQLELARVERLFAGLGTNSGTLSPSIFSRSDLDVARRDAAMAEAEVKELEGLVSNIDLSLKQMAPGEIKLDDEIPSSVRSAIGVEERNLDLMEAQFAPISLVAPFDGVVSVVHRLSGESIQPGEAILTIARERASRVVAFVRQPINLDPKPGMKVEVRTRSGLRAQGVGEVISVGSQLEPVFPSLLPKSSNQGGNNSVGELGLPLLVSLPPDFPVHPGEIVDLRSMER